MSDIAAVVAAAASNRGIGAGGDLVRIYPIQVMLYTLSFILMLLCSILGMETSRRHGTL